MKKEQGSNQATLFSFWKNTDTKKIQSIVKPKENEIEENRLNKENISNNNSGIKNFVDNKHALNTLEKKNDINTYSNLITKICYNH